MLIRFTTPTLGLLLSLCNWASAAELPDYPSGENAGIHVNYTEANVGEYTLPDPLQLQDGTPVDTAEAWQSQRRPELIRILEENQYGRAPGRPDKMRFEVIEDATPAFDGRAIRKQVRINFFGEEDGPALDLLIYLPPNATGPVPLLLNIGFTPNNLMVDDPGVKVGRVWGREQNKRVPAKSGRRFGELRVLPTLERGFGIATFNYADVDPDALGALEHGVRGHYLAQGANKPAADEWGSIAAWAWGISRAIDYFESDPQVDSDRIAITGVSRLGKTVLWAGAVDPRVALVIASCSGEGGAALSRRDYGETIGHLVAPSRYPYQFAENFQKWATNPQEAPMDAHLIIALIAPRPLLLQTGTEDKWSDPKGEFLAARAATPVYVLFGKRGIDLPELPPASELVGDDLAYYMHDGGHGLVPSDWDIYLDFLDAHLKP